MKNKLLRIKTILTNRLNTLFFYLCKIFPVNDSVIVFESEADFTDNSYALFDYMNNKGLFKTKYTPVWVVNDTSNHKYLKYPNVKFVDRRWGVFHPMTMFYLSTCRYYIYDHNCLLGRLYKKKKQEIVYLSHGRGFKACKGVDFSKIRTTFDVMFATGEIPAKGLAYFWKCSLDKVIQLGYPRIDYFFTDNRRYKEIVDERWGFYSYRKILFWMPTFRKTNNNSISEDYICNETGLPLVSDYEQLNKLNSFLNECNLLLVLKIHHLQADLPVFKETLSNILILRDEDLLDADLQLYQVVPFSDALITDYSSISIDYMPLDKPVIYTLDDYEEYSRTRGFEPENAIDYFKGYHVYDCHQLIDAIEEIVDGVDKYKAERRAVIGEFFTFVDGNSSQRILDYLHID